MQTSKNKPDWKEYQGLVRHIAFKYYKTNYFVKQLGDINDVISIANLGLLKAIELFDETKDCEFVTYAACKIQFAILDAAREVGFIKIPCTAQKQGIKEINVVRIQAHKYENDYKDVEKFEPTAKEKQEVEYDIELLLKQLNPKHAVLLIRYFGLDGQPKMTLKQIGQKINMSEPHVAQQINAALNFARQCKMFINSGLQEAG